MLAAVDVVPRFYICNSLYIYLIADTKSGSSPSRTRPDKAQRRAGQFLPAANSGREPARTEAYRPRTRVASSSPSTGDSGLPDATSHVGGALSPETAQAACRAA